ncbi:MAG TPA: GNAT family N-acetyltransferase [Burkholderiales bacterium]|nr:GNAT family N-acetyltransferase [Burkholderiales bacterium]
MIRACTERDLCDIYAVINDGAHAYRGVIPTEHWRDPYMPLDELRSEIAAGVRFWGYELSDQLIGVMGLQEVLNAALIRHAYVRTAYRNQGVGGQLLAELRNQTERRLLVGTWAAARWAIRFYEKHGFRLADERTKNRLLKRYWSIATAQIAASVVLAGPTPTTRGKSRPR